jgi:hypothetical protein
MRQWLWDEDHAVDEEVRVDFDRLSGAPPRRHPKGQNRRGNESRTRPLAGPLCRSLAGLTA